MVKILRSIVIVGGGEDWQKEKVISFCQAADFIIAADSGLAILHELSITADLIIGDLDSVSPNILQHYATVPIEKFPDKKDFSDSELAIKKALSMNPKEIILLAVTGNYFDHSYASIINLFRNRHSCTIKIITSNATIFPITEKTTLLHLKGRRFSLFPLCNIVNFSMLGAKYNSPKKNLKVADYSLSNVIVGERLEINLEKGMLFCVLFDQGWQ